MRQGSKQTLLQGMQRQLLNPASPAEAAMLSGKLRDAEFGDELSPSQHAPRHVPRKSYRP